MLTSPLKCPSCHSFFAFQNTPKLLKTCPHSICLSCLQTIPNCPIDAHPINLNKYGLKSFLTNTKILELIQNENYPFQTINKKKEEHRFSFAQKSKPETHKNFNSSTGLRHNHSNWQLCQTHFKKADFIDKQSLQIVCTLCISESPSEINKFVNYEELTKHLADLTDQTYKIYESLNKKSQHYSKKHIDSFIEQEVIKKKERQSYEIRAYFQKLIQTIRKQQKHVLQKLDEVSKQTSKSIKSHINLDTFRKMKEEWGQEVQKLISIMQSVYDWSGFKQAFEYFKNDKKKSLLIDQGQRLMQQSCKMDEGLNDMVQNEMKKLQFRFDTNFFQEISSVSKSAFSERNTSSAEKTQIHEKSIPKMCFDAAVNTFEEPKKIKPNFKICHSLSETFCFKIFQIRPLIQPIIQQQIHMQKYSPQREYLQNQIDSAQQSSEQDFLLDTEKSQCRYNQTLTKNQITFEEQYSLLDNSQMPTRQQFTPILRKEEQDSMSVIQDESTIIKINHPKGQQPASPMTYTKSDDITIEIRPNKPCKTGSTSFQKFNNSSAELLNTFGTLNLNTNRKTRSPLKSLNSNMTLSCSEKKKLGIPEKYIPIWESTKYDNCEVIDFTGAELGDEMVLQLATNIAESKNIKSVKLIRNKVSDEIIPELIQRLTKSKVTSLNLSQNMLSQKTLGILEKMNLGNLKSITLSLNKIVLRKVKDRIEKFKEKGVTLTV